MFQDFYARLVHFFPPVENARAQRTLVRDTGRVFEIFQTVRFAMDGTGSPLERGRETEEQFLRTLRRRGGTGILFKAEHFTAARSTLVMENPPPRLPTPLPTVLLVHPLCPTPAAPRN